MKLRESLTLQHPSPSGTLPMVARRWSTRVPAFAYVACLALALAIGAPVRAATIDVTTTADELDFIPNGECSLREAVVTVNEQRAQGVGGCSVSGTLGDDDAIVVPAGLYRLTRITAAPLSTVDQDADNLDLLRDVTIRGAGADVTTIDGEALYYPLQQGGEWPLAEGGVLRVASGARATVTGVMLRTGWATEGGAVYVAGTLTLRDAAVVESTAEGPGGGIFNDSALTLERVSVSGNRADGEGLPARVGGGIYNAGTLVASNVTISGNQAVVGGGLFVSSVSDLVTLSSVTITDNDALGQAGLTVLPAGGLVNDAAGATLRVENSLIAGNRGAQGAGPDCVGAVDSRGFNLIGDATDCSGFDATGDMAGAQGANIDPRLAPLADYGGTTHTHALLPLSPAIDAGPLGILDGCPDTDQRGFARANDGDLNGFLHCDIGAYEAPTGTAAGTAPEANLDIALSAEPDPVGAGGALSYTVRVQNNGPDAATGVYFELELPTGTTGVTGLPAGCVPATLSLVCDLGDLDASESVSHVIGVKAPSSLGVVIATATVTSTSEDGDPDDDAAQVSTLVVGTNSADLALAISGPSGVAFGGDIDYVLTATNAGPQAADASARVTAFLPTGTTFEDASSGCARVNATVTCGVPDLAAGASRQLNLTVAAPTSATTVTLTASVLGAAGSDGDVSNNSAAWSTRVQAPPPPSADLFIQKLGPSTAQVGSDITYSLIVNDNGPAPAEQVRVTDTLPDGVQVVSLPDACQEDAGTITCDLGALELGQLVNLQVVVRAPSTAGSILNTAAVEDLGDTVDPYPVNDLSGVRTDVTAAPPPPGADLALSKSAPLRVLPGTDFEYALVVTNNGPDDAIDVVLSDALPASLTLLSPPTGCAMDAGVLLCQLGDVAAGASASVTVAVRAPADPAELRNSASVTSSTPDAEAGNDQASADTSVSADEPPSAPTLAMTLHPDSEPGVTAPPGADQVVALRFVAAAGATEAVRLEALEIGLVRGEEGAAKPADGLARTQDGLAQTQDGSARTQDGLSALRGRALPARGRSSVLRADRGLSAETRPIEVVALYGDADDDGAPDDGELLASGTFQADGRTLVLTLPNGGAASTLSASATGSYLVVVDVAEGAIPSSSAPAIALAALALAPVALRFGRFGRRRQRAVLVATLTVWLGGLALTSCRTTPPPVPPAEDASYRLVLESVTATGVPSGLEAEVTGVPLTGTRIDVKR